MSELSIEIPADSVRFVSPRINPRCPSCHCFVRLDSGTCSACGFAFALGIEARQGQYPRPFAGLDSRKPDPPALSGGNAQALENLQPNGKIRKQKKSKDFTQMELFAIPETSFDLKEVL
jgi:hypothetical protein